MSFNQSGGVMKFKLSVCFVLSLLFSAVSMAVSNSVVVVDDLEAGATSNYTLSFTASRPLNSGDGIAFVTANSTGPNFGSATLVSISGGSITGTVTSQNQTSITVTLNGGAVTVGTTITMVYAGVVNPGAAGQGPDYSIRTIDFDSNPFVASEDIAGSTYTASTAPVVVNPIADQNLNAADGATVVVADLDTVFSDADGVLSFMTDGNSNPAVASFSVGVGNSLSVTPLASGTTSLTVTASSGGESVSDTFAVRVVGELANVVITPDNLNAGESSNYTVSFSPSSSLQTGQFLAINSGTTGPNYTNATLTSVSGGTGLSASVFQTPNDQAIAVEFTAGSATAAQTVTLVFGNVTNPGAAGQGPDYTMILQQLVPAQLIDQATAPGNNYGAVGLPTVVQQIADQNLNEADGTASVVADLNTIFTDGDGDALTFSVDAGHNTSIATAMVSGNELLVTPTGPGSTTFTIRASDLPSGTGEGEVTTQFDVSVVGIMDNATFVPANDDTEAITSYTFSFTPSSTVGVDQVIAINNQDVNGPDYSAATLTAVSGGDLSMAIRSNGASSTGIAFDVTGGSAGLGDTVSITIGGVVNPTLGGAGPDYAASLLNLIPVTVIEQAAIAGTVFEDVGIPVVTAPIADQVLQEVNGPMVVVNDLNTVFTDGNGQNLVFSVLPGHDSNVATASINNNELTVTPVGSGTTTVMIEASDVAAGGTGTAVDSFMVRVVGELGQVSITPTSLEVSETTSYTISFRPAGEINDSDILEISTGLTGPDFSAATLQSLTGGDLNASLVAQSSPSVSFGFFSGTATSADTVTLVLDNVTNPVATGTAPDFFIAVVNLSNGTIQDSAMAPGLSYVDTDTIFNDGFETNINRNLLAKALISTIPRHANSSYDQPFYDISMGQYLFLGQALSRDAGELMRSPAEVQTWLVSVLVTELPLADWDADGVLNFDDVTPFGLD